MPTTDPQLARLVERVEHIVDRLEDLKPLVALVPSLQRDQEHLTDTLRQLSTIAELRGTALHQLDKRVLVLERWHKGMVGFSAVAMSLLLTVGGYAKNFIDTMESDRQDTRNRLMAVEFIIQSPNFQKAMENREVSAGSK